MKICVIGLGKLGLPLAALFANGGNEVKAYDANESLRNALTSGLFESNEPGLVAMLDENKSRLKVTNSLSEAVSESEIVFLIVPTPSRESGHFSNDFIIEAIREIGGALTETQKIVIDIVSTVMPGSCEGPIREELEKSSNRKLGSNLGLCYNPEFIALGTVIHDMQYPDMHLVGESSEWAGEKVTTALKSIVKKDVLARRMSLAEAELVKIAVNNFVTMKISFANSLMQCADALGNIDIDAVTDAIGLDTRVGGKYLKAAAAYGGPCFPRDTRALAALYLDLGLKNALSEATEVINSEHSRFISEKIMSLITPESKVGIAGLSYKSGTRVTEESPGLKLLKDLSSMGINVKYWDDGGAVIDNENQHSKAFSSPRDLINNSDFVIISRPILETEEFKTMLFDSGKPYLDLWRLI